MAIWTALATQISRKILDWATPAQYVHTKRSIDYATHTTPPLDARRCSPVHVYRTDGARCTRHSYSVLSIPPHVIGLICALHHKGARDGCRATAQRARAHPATADGLRRLLVLVQAPPPPSGPCDARNRNAREGKRGGGGRRAGVGTDACTWEGGGAGRRVRGRLRTGGVALAHAEKVTPPPPPDAS